MGGPAPMSVYASGPAGVRRVSVGKREDKRAWRYGRRSVVGPVRQLWGLQSSKVGTDSYWSATACASVAMCSRRARGSRTCA